MQRKTRTSYTTILQVSVLLLASVLERLRHVVVVVDGRKAIRVPELGKPGLQAGAVVARLGSGLCLLSSRIENTSLFSCLRSSTTTTTSTSATLLYISYYVCFA